MKIRCHTNLDLHPNEEWIDELPCRPMVGDLITSSSGLELEVVRVAFKQSKYCDEVVAHTELHLPPHRYENIIEFEKWYKNRK